MCSLPEYSLTLTEHDAVRPWIVRGQERTVASPSARPLAYPGRPMPSPRRPDGPLRGRNYPVDYPARPPRSRKPHSLGAF